MGNCLRHESEVQWGGEDWSTAISSVDRKLAMKLEEEEEDVINRSNKKGEHMKIKEVKVRITKKQLEELLVKIDVQQQNSSMEQILGELVKVSVHCETHLRSWKPRLQSIPEF